MSAARGWLRLLGSELRLIIGRRRNQVGLGVLFGLVVMVGIALKVSAMRHPRSPSGDLIAAVAGNGIFLGFAALSIEIEGSVPLECQRCLGRIDWPVSQATEVLLAGDGKELARLDEATEGEVILADRPLEPATLVEDELVLTLPFAPRHEGECPPRL